jgi:hypothetical protein
MNRKRWALRQLLTVVEGKINKDKSNTKSFKKFWRAVSTLEKPKEGTLDKLSLFAGFQDWDSFKETLYGDTDAQVNWEGDEKDKLDQIPKK